MRCGYTLVEGSAIEQGVRTPFTLVPGNSSARPFVETILHDQVKLKSDLSNVKEALAEEKTLSAKRHEDLFVLLSALSAKLTPPEKAP